MLCLILHDIPICHEVVQLFINMFQFWLPTTCGGELHPLRRLREKGCSPDRFNPITWQLEVPHDDGGERLLLWEWAFAEKKLPLRVETWVGEGAVALVESWILEFDFSPGKSWHLVWVLPVISLLWFSFLENRQALSLFEQALSPGLMVALCRRSCSVCVSLSNLCAW